MRETILMKKNSGFTLMEVMVTVGIIGIMAAIAAALFDRAVDVCSQQVVGLRRMDQVAIVALPRQGVSSMLQLQLCRRIVAVEALLICTHIQKKRFSGVMGGMAAATAFFDGLMTDCQGKGGLVMAAETELWRVVVKQKGVHAVVRLMALQAQSSSDRLVNGGSRCIVADIPMTGEAQAGFICFQIGLANQPVIAVATLTGPLFKWGMDVIFRC